MQVLYSTLITPDIVFNINSKVNLAQFEIFGDDVATVRSQLMIIAWNRGDTHILEECNGDVTHPRFCRFLHSRGMVDIEVLWEPIGVRVVIWDGKKDK